MIIMYKIMEKCNTSGYKSLFHGRKPIYKDGDIIIAEKKMGYESYNKDGAKKLYLTGIHVVDTLELCKKYLKRFKRQDNKVIVQCSVWGIRKKPKGNPGVYLADKVKIIGEC